VALGVLALPTPAGLFLLYYVGFGLLWVWWLNLFNFMDGIDGIAGSEAAAISGGVLLFAAVGHGLDPPAALLAAGVLGAALGFLRFNWAPAQVFLGDVGSTVLGYLCGFLLLDLATRGHWRVALILPLYFLADATITLGRRLLRGERIWQAHREHFYQRAVRRGRSHPAVTDRVIAAGIVLVLLGWTAENGWPALSLGIACATVAALLYVLAKGI
jgi:UDP-N-acetylmuramyl pentapeptide phosphotransferase/UDP-N-acetylglucosamine-1-phosphate transferase